ncbi:MAG: PilW family protein [Elusimicrobiota bacterium]
MRKSGFSLIEMIIAVFLSLMVLLGIISVSTAIIREHFEGMQKGKLSGETILSLDQMDKEIENADSLGSVTGTAVSGCANWSNIALGPASGGPLNSAQPVESFYYCAAAMPGTNPQSYTLWRYSCVSAGPPYMPPYHCPFPAPSPCGAALGVSGCSGPVSIVYNSLYPDPLWGATFFGRTTEGVIMHFMVGNINPTPQHPVPIFYRVNENLSMQKSYNDASD